MNSQLKLAFHRVTLNSVDHQIQLQTPDGTFTITHVSQGIKAAFDLLMQGETAENIRKAVQGQHFSDVLRLESYLRQFARYIAYHMEVDQACVASLYPTSPFFQPAAFENHYTLSRFAYLRREKDGYVLECPTAYAQLRLQRVSLLDWLTEDHEAACLFRELVGIAGMLEGETASLWEFHDFLFMTKTRERYERTGTGSVPRSVPVVKAPMSDEIVALFRPDMDRLSQEDVPFTQVLENRASVRKYSQMMTAKQLGEFLYRTARIKGIVSGKSYETSKRVYPSAGASYSLEIYAAVTACEGLDAGFYHYCPQRHVLEKMADVAFQAMVDEAALYTGKQVEPQVLLIITSRFERILWKYESTSLSLVLKDVGGLFQTMYLVATAMGLSPCAIGVGNSDIFARSTGLDYMTETSVGEFLLGG